MKGLLYTVTKMLSILKSHIGSRGDAHAVVSRETAGFMSADQYEMLLASYGSLTVVSSKNVFEMPPGKYIGAGMENMPKGDKGNFVIEIYDEISNHPFDEGLGRTKLIKATQVYTNEEYRYFYRSSGQGYIPEGWTQILKNKELATGSFKYIGTEIFLSDDLFKYKKLEFIFKGFSEIVYFKEQGTIELNHFAIGGNGDTAYLKFMTLSKVDERKFKIARNIQMNFSEGGISSTSEQLELIKIVGYA